ncbi:MAG TPA: sugar phosphate isomerase/epimerase [Anaerohalosphaeraceae bacterium]|nr:sugar phosphate isomerase/epimerase [Anaerohalosphaeraceae bacterium]
MQTLTSRRDVLKLAGLGTIAAASGQSLAQTNPDTVSAAKIRKPAYKIGLASYTTRKLDLDQTIAIAKQLKLECISIKQDFHLQMNKPVEEQKALAQKVRDAGLDFYACGVIYMKTADEVKRAFEFAKTVGIRVIVGVPNHELLDLTESCCKEYDLIVAIHNHGPGDKLYPTAAGAYELIKNRDKRLGLCIDLGHTMRSGINPAEEIAKVADRLLDFHFKDVTAAEAKGGTVEMGRGVIDIPAVVRALDKIGYDKLAAFEYEKDQDAPQVGLAESVGYLRGVIRTLQG